jgi:hypothetical protein
MYLGELGREKVRGRDLGKRRDVIFFSCVLDVCLTACLSLLLFVCVG